MTILQCEHLYLGGGKWLSPGFVQLSAQGLVESVSGTAPPDAKNVRSISGYVLPGIPNAHSHVFQWAMAGLAEYSAAGSKVDDFWSWREAMYGLAQTLDPDRFQKLAVKAYKSMRRCGYTSVAEFHYVHHDKNGAPYQNPAEMSCRLIAAAQDAGIRLTLLPVLYMASDFGKPATDGQKRFLSASLEDYFKLCDSVETALKKNPHARLGYAPHSMRAVPSEVLQKFWQERQKNKPVHMHVAEQRKEIDSCRAALGKTPVEWLLQSVAFGEEFYLVHGTQMSAAEIKDFNGRGATIVLCPSTEGNLGDGIFPLSDFLKSSGKLCIGTDSHVGLSPWEEMRWLDYVQRLKEQKRQVLTHGSGEHGTWLFDQVVTHGRAALGAENKEMFNRGALFEAVVVDKNVAELEDKPLEKMLSVLVYSGQTHWVKETWLGAQQVIHP